jgi:uncharacterized protein YndB with AHSA1/START domain
MANPVLVTTPSDTEVQVVREFNAPRELVFRAWTDPSLIQRWMNGPEGWKSKAEGEARVGGTSRLEWSGPDGASMAMTVHYREVVPPERLVTVEVFDEAWHPGEAVTTLVFTEEEPGITVATMTIVYESKEARDIAVATGMTDGMAMSYEAFDQLLAELQA